jgi:hypothetical protein
VDSVRSEIAKLPRPGVQRSVWVARVMSAVSVSQVRVPLAWRQMFFRMWSSRPDLWPTMIDGCRAREPTLRRIWRMNRGESPTGTTAIRRLDGLLPC